MSRIMRGMSDWELKSRRSSSTLRMSASVGRSGGGWRMHPERTNQEPINRTQSLTRRMDIPSGSAAHSAQTCRDCTSDHETVFIIRWEMFSNVTKTTTETRAHRDFMVRALGLPQRQIVGKRNHAMQSVVECVKPLEVELG